jgi:hypothetical protein
MEREQEKRGCQKQIDRKYAPLQRRVKTVREQRCGDAGRKCGTI